MAEDEGLTVGTSWAPEVIADSSGKWTRNALRFATKVEADANVRDLYSRWTAVREYRSVETDEPVNYQWDVTEGRSVPLPRAATPDLVVTAITTPEQIAEAIRDLTGGNETHAR